MMQPRDLTRETVPYLRSAGCRIVFLGIQSWDKELRENLLERFVSNACMEEAINSLKGSGIQLVVDNLFGLPGQDYEQLLQANMKYTALRPKRIFFFHLRYYPKTVMLDKVQGKSDVSADRYTDIVNGTDGGGLCLTLPAGRTSGGDKELKKIKILLFCFDLLPGKAIRFIVNKKLYRYIPSVIAPSLFMFLRTLFSSDLDSRLRIEENVYKYAYFMVKKIRIVLDKRRTNRGNYAADAE
jgi:Coproporphyrinogen III oxidase and related Fe-S oxidoreductases